MARVLVWVFSTWWVAVFRLDGEREKAELLLDLGSLACEGGPMIELYRDRDMTRVGHFQSLLETEGIKTFVRNESLSVTEAAIPVFSPALCIMDEADKDRAVAILEHHLAAAREAVKTEVVCPSCGETNPGNFEVCWNCGGDLTDSE